MAKKSFKDGDNPALAFISTQEQPKGTDNTEDTHKAHETKSKRLNLLIQPSVHKDLERIARVQGISLNELINNVMKDYQESHMMTVSKYIEIWGDK